MGIHDRQAQRRRRIAVEHFGAARLGIGSDHRYGCRVPETTVKRIVKQRSDWWTTPRHSNGLGGRGGNKRQAGGMGERETVQVTPAHQNKIGVGWSGRWGFPGTWHTCCHRRPRSLRDWGANCDCMGWCRDAGSSSHRVARLTAPRCLARLEELLAGIQRNAARNAWAPSLLGPKGRMG